MAERDKPLIAARDIALAIGLLTRFPVRISPDAAQRGAASAWAYPLAGLCVGAIAALTGAIGLWLGLPAAAAAGLILATSILVTGAMHEDGLADSADGLWGGWEKAQRLAIMKDSRIGTYGVLALILSTGLRWTALTTLIGHGHLIAAVVAAAVISRAPMVALMHALPHASETGLSRQVGRPSLSTATIAAGLALVAAILLLQTAALQTLAAVALATLAAAAIAKAKIGGQTGDILGATQQLCEIAILLTLAALL